MIDRTKIKKFIQMRVKYILTMALMTTFSLNAQEPMTVSGYGSRSIPGDLRYAEALFIQEKARISFIRGGFDVINLTEESAKIVGNQKIGVVFVNNAAQGSVNFLKDELITLEVFPVNDSNPAASKLAARYKIPLYFCKCYKPQNAEREHWKNWHEENERKIADFLQHPPVGDTLNATNNVYNIAENYIDSRYTPLLIRNLTNDGEIHLEWEGHYHTVPNPHDPNARSETHSFATYNAIRVSDFARKMLNRIFHSHDRWLFAIPERNASAEEWQTWLDELLNNETSNNHGVKQ
jgi:hypothetical protein